MRGCPNGGVIWTRSNFTLFSEPFGLPLCIMSYFCSLAMNTSTGRKALEMKFIAYPDNPYRPDAPLTYTIGAICFCDTSKCNTYLWPWR